MNTWDAVGYLRTSNREAVSAGGSYADTGFRCVRGAPGMGAKQEVKVLSGPCGRNPTSM